LGDEFWATNHERRAMRDLSPQWEPSFKDLRVMLMCS